MPVFALYNFDDADTTARDSALGNGAQDGLYLNGAAASSGQVVLDGQNDLVKIYPNPVFQMDRGTLDISFALGADPLCATQTVLSRDSVGNSDGGYRIEILADGAIVVSHETATGVESFGTGPGFAHPGDVISLSYSWDQGGSGGLLVIGNSTTGGSFSETVPNTLTMDMSGQGINQPWIIGAGQAMSDPNVLNNIDQHFQGTVTSFQLSDTVDNGRDGIVRGTAGGDLIDSNYIDPFDADRVDANDAIISGDAPNDDRILAGAGNDTVLAGQGDDSVEGCTGDDLVASGSGSDTVYGQDGNDLIDTRGDATPLPDQDYPGLYGADGAPHDDRDSVAGGTGNDTILTGDDADTISGGYGDDRIDAGFDDDLIQGNQGNDTIIGAEGNDTIDAGQGDDLVYGGYGPGVPDAVNIPDASDLRPNNGRDSIVGGMGNDTIYGMDDDDTLAGGVDDDLIYGGIDDDSIGGEMGNDQLFGDEGNDIVNGGQGNDTLTGGAGADLLSGDADRDDFLVVSQSQGAGDTVYGGAGGDDFDRLILSGAGSYRLRDVVEDSDGNGIDGRVEFLDADGNVTGSMGFTNIEDIVPCFTPGTLIATPKGEVPVESLRAGDRVITRDNGIQEIRWAGQKALGWRDLAANPHLKPVLIRQGSLGNGLPERDMMVSPNHRILAANDRTALYFDEHEVLVSAKHLVAVNGIQVIDSIGTTYLHFMFDRHEVVLGNGAWTESFQPGDMTLKGMGNAQRTEIFELFPELKTDVGLNNYQAARRTLKKHEARLLAK